AMLALFKTGIRLVARAISLAAVLGLAGIPGAGAQVTAADGGGHWIATWGASPQAATPSDVALLPGDVSAAGFTNQTVRNIVFTSVGGGALRVRLTNSFGSQPVTFDEVDVGVVASGADLVAGSSRRASF